MSEIGSFLSHLDELHQIMSGKKLYASRDSDDIDFMFFESENTRDTARLQIRISITNFIEYKYPMIVDNYICNISAITSTDMDFYNHIRVLNKNHKYITSILMEDPMNYRFIELYDKLMIKLKDQLKSPVITDDMFKENYRLALLHWGNFLQTEIVNDGFDRFVIQSKIIDLVYTLVLLTI